MSDGYAYSLELSAGQLHALLSSLEQGFGQAILESVTCVRFVAIARPPDECHFDPDFEPERWEKGRAFGDALEVRWRRCLGKYLALVIADDAPLNLDPSIASEVPLPEPVPLQKLEGTKQVTLWGELQGENETDLPDQDRPYWYELRIPQFLAYPSTERADRLVIEVARYRTSGPSNQGQEVTEDYPADYVYRFVDLKRWEPDRAGEPVSG